MTAYSLHVASTLRALAIRELLGSIFRKLPRSQNVRNALVCKSWTELAIEEMFWEVDFDVFMLLSGRRSLNGWQVTHSLFALWDRC